MAPFNTVMDLQEDILSRLNECLYYTVYVDLANTMPERPSEVNDCEGNKFK